MYVHEFICRYVYMFIRMLYIYIYMCVCVCLCVCVCIIEPVGFMYACISVHADVSAVCAHAVVGSCCQLCSALHTLSSGSSLHVTAQSI